MAFKTLLTHVVADRGCAARLQMTADIARVFSADLIGLGAQAPWPFATANDSRGPDFERLVRTAQAEVAAAQTAFSAGLADSAIRVSWRHEIDYPNAALARNAAAADLVVGYRMGRDFDTSIHAEPDTLVMEAGVPVLLLPDRAVEFKADTVLLAWKNTRETRAAISMALPVLTAAKRVLVAAICRSREVETVERELTDVSQRLAKHGVTATTLAEIDAPGGAGRKLLRIAQTDHSDLIVAGAYGHSRLREWAIGGVTHDLIEDRRRFVLFGR